MIKKGLFIVAVVTAIVLIAAKPSSGTVGITDYGSLSVTLDKPANSIIPAMRQVGSLDNPYYLDAEVEWTTVKIHNETEVSVLWDISYKDVIKPSYYWIADGVRMVDEHGNYVTCSPPPRDMKNWVVIHETLPVEVGPKQTKEVLITFEIPRLIWLSEIWEFRLNYRNLSQDGNVLLSYDQIWQIYTERR